MAKVIVLLPIIASHLAIFTLFSAFTTTIVAGADSDFGTTKTQNLYRLKKEKLTHFRFYWHDIYSGPNPTVVPIVNSTIKNSVSGFGFISMMDDPLTLEPQQSSKLVGRAQGLYGAASQEEVGLLMVMNFVFLEGKYNGSTITILGRNKALEKVREMPVISGTGLFRFARGYVEASTHSYNQTSGDAVVEYNAYVLHY
ncbi:hypothetical protein P3X46_026808 [Hevea brasiliensis]|uniref:Dirigent protein n=2 Tax=Hevea brasiliensis TaxID=3981 RepID=A0ABQ9KXU0_HEVBR|nr:hypothetical protein P3X46_026808 [Hevea brasiliensis]